MPKVQALIDAEAALAAVETTIAPLREKHAQFHAQLAWLDAEINAKTAEAREQVERAKVLQSVSLTKWVMDPGRTTADPSFQRFVLRADGRPSDQRLDSRAWLRRVCHDSDWPSLRRWRWTLSARNQVIIDPCEKDPSAPAPSIEAMIAAADAVLVAQGFILTDMENGA